jgi:N-acetylmuramic acid 6-phosphate etherase
MSETSDRRSDDFLRIAGQFQLGALTTEASHPVTARLSEAVAADIAAGLRQLFEVDTDVLSRYREFTRSGRAHALKETVLRALEGGGRLFFTGCGSTGRLSIQLVAIWRDFWQRQRARGLNCTPSPADWENRAHSVMAGGDFALIKAVEGFEDFTAFGRKQIADLGLRTGDVVFAITEGGETSFVLGTATYGAEVGARVFLVYNNPDDVLCDRVERSRAAIQDPRIEKLNLTTGPMAITGSTRMQATTIQLCVLLTILEMTLRDLLTRLQPGGPCALDASVVPSLVLDRLEQIHATLLDPGFLAQATRWVELEAAVYRAGGKNNYYADRFGIDVLTDTTERSPTYCTPPFRKFDDPAATESWAFLFVPQPETPQAWEHVIKRRPRCVEWTEPEIRPLVPHDRLPRTTEILSRIGYPELLRFRIGLDGLPHRPLRAGDSAFGIVADSERASLLDPNSWLRRQLESHRQAAVRIGFLCVGSPPAIQAVHAAASTWAPEAVALGLPVPESDLLLDGVTRAGLKMLLNAVSTCTMVRLGRVMGNFMVWVVPSNLKLIDRATRYIQRLTSLDYPAANRLLFEVIEYVEPRMRADQAYPPVVGVAVLRARDGLDNAAAERRLLGSAPT